MTAKTIKIGSCKFRDPKIAEKVAANHTAFAATVNRDGMTEDERKAAFAAFFQLSATPKQEG